MSLIWGMGIRWLWKQYRQALSNEKEANHSGIGAITRLENALDSLEGIITNKKVEIETNEKDLKAAQTAVEIPFEQAEELESLQNELSEIDAELDLGKQEIPIVLDEPDGEKMELEILDEEEEELEIA